MNFAIKGDILYSYDKKTLVSKKDSYVVCENGISQGIFKTLPNKYKGIKVYDYTNKLIIPGLVDMHLHAPQYSFMGLHMDLELIEWLNKYTFPEESKYKNMKYAKSAYDIFVNELKTSPTTRFSLFATIHVPATLYLMEKLEKTNLKGFVGKVNMDRNSVKSLQEKTSESVRDTLKWVEKSQDFKNIKPIITPRFTPSCSDELMLDLSKIVKDKNLPVQSHISENRAEIKWVKELVSGINCYEDAYDKFELLGTHTNTIMAHYVWPDEKGIEKIKKNKVWIAHSPSSNRNLSSGLAPIKRYLDMGIKVGLATDIAGGSYISMFRAMEDAITVGKIRACVVDNNHNGVNLKEAFYMATKGGGSFFGKVGSFEKGYEFDALVLDESKIPTVLMPKLNIAERFERFVYMGNGMISGKFVFGKKIV